MIVVKLQGGLGNQLFQYALGRRLALARNVPLKLDTSRLGGGALRTLRLGHFNVEASIATDEDRMRAKGGAGFMGAIRRRIDGLRPYYRRSWVKERQLFYDPNILLVKRTVFLDGYWQSEKYFKDMAPRLHSEFTLRSGPSDKTRQVAEQIDKCTGSVSLHIRRGDYLSRAFADAYGVCSLDYYVAAVKLVCDQLGEAKIFVFSDDLLWTQQNLRLVHPVIFVTHNGPDADHEDLWLMSRCKHHIIANSTFSWWGAWLGSCPTKIVVAPKRWANIAEYNHEDRIPPGWMTV